MGQWTRVVIPSSSQSLSFRNSYMAGGHVSCPPLHVEKLKDDDGHMWWPSSHQQRRVGGNGRGISCALPMGGFHGKHSYGWIVEYMKCISASHLGVSNDVSVGSKLLNTGFISWIMSQTYMYFLRQRQKPMTSPRVHTVNRRPVVYEPLGYL